MNWHRIEALCRRFTYVYRRSIFRILDLTFYPIVDLLVWGFVTLYMLQAQGKVMGAITFLIGAIIFFNVLYRAQQAVSLAFLEDIWTSNLLNIFVAPVRVSEFVTATFITGLVQAVLVAGMMFGLSAIMYSFNSIVLGLNFIPLFLNLLLMGWSLGLITTGLILRFGHQAEASAWAVPFLIQPVSAVFYPVSILPKWLQHISWCLPSTYVFEGMRAVLKGGSHIGGYLLWATGLNIIYFVLAGIFFGCMFQTARNRGLLSKLGA